MKILFATALALTLSLTAVAHEGGHGTVTEGGKYGGITTPIVDNAEAGKGEKATTLFKGELVRTASGKLSLYLFDSKMNLAPLDQFSAEVEANLEVKKKGKFTYVGKFMLKKTANHYEGQLPAIEYKPFNIDLYFYQGSKKLFGGFSNLD